MSKTETSLKPVPKQKNCFRLDALMHSSKLASKAQLKSHKVRMALISVSQVFGDCEVAGDCDHYATTMTCTKNDSFVYKIKRADFLRL